jgi:hypothetical protein
VTPHGVTAYQKVFNAMNIQTVQELSEVWMKFDHGHKPFFSGVLSPKYAHQLLAKTNIPFPRLYPQAT